MKRLVVVVPRKAVVAAEEVLLNELTLLGGHFALVVAAPTPPPPRPATTTLASDEDVDEKDEDGDGRAEDGFGEEGSSGAASHNNRLMPSFSSSSLACTRPLLLLPPQSVVAWVASSNAPKVFLESVLLGELSVAVSLRVFVPGSKVDKVISPCFPLYGSRVESCLTYSMHIFISAGLLGLRPDPPFLPPPEPSARYCSSSPSQSGGKKWRQQG
jgi:hypothetical protein